MTVSENPVFSPFPGTSAKEQRMSCEENAAMLVVKLLVY